MTDDTNWSTRIMYSFVATLISMGFTSKRDQRPGYDADFRLDSLSIAQAAEPIASTYFDGGMVHLRPHRLSDGPAWRQTRLHERERLQPAMGRGDRNWTDQNSLIEYVQHCGGLRYYARRGLAVHYLAFHGDRVIGECNYQIDPRTASAEVSVWLSSSVSHEARLWLGTVAALRVLKLPAGIPRLIGPSAVDKAGVAEKLDNFGWNLRGVSRQLREFRGEPTDHEMYWLESSPDVIALLEQAEHMLAKQGAKSRRT